MTKRYTLSLFSSSLALAVNEDLRTIGALKMYLYLFPLFHLFTFQRPKLRRCRGKIKVAFCIGLYKEVLGY